MSTDRTNANRAFDSLASAWLDEGPEELADRVVDAALREVHLTRQRRRRAAPWRTEALNRYLAAVAAALVLVVAGLAYGSLNRGPGPAASGQSPSSPPSMATTQPSSSIRPSSGAGIPHGPLAGTYTTTAFKPAVTFTIAGGWSNQHELADYLGMWMGDPNHEITIGRVDGDPIVYARPNPMFTIGTPTAITIGGLPAKEVSLVLSPDAGKGNNAGAFPLAPYADSSTDGKVPLRIAFSGSTCRVIWLQVGGKQVVILTQRPTVDTPAFDQQVQAILDSISFN